MSAWQQLIQQYADGRPICNCGEAYYTPCGKGLVNEGGKTVRKTDMLACAYGCSANQIFAKEDIARRVLQDLA